MDDTDKKLLESINHDLGIWTDYILYGTKPEGWDPRAVRDYETLFELKRKILNEPIGITQVNHINIPEPQSEEDWDKLYENLQPKGE